MKSIWQYQVSLSQTVTLPKGAQILCIQVQGEIPTIWALISPGQPGQPGEQRTIAVYGTGHEMPDDPGRYIGTFQLAEGMLVLHAFEQEARNAITIP